MKKRLKVMKKHFKKKKGNAKPKALEFVKADLDKAVKRSKALLITNELSEPFVLRAPNFENENIKIRLYKDEENQIVDYNNTLLTVLYLGKKKLHYYQATVDHLNGNVEEEVTGEVKYSNIISTELELDNNYETNNSPVLSVLDLILTLKNNEELVINLRNHYAFNEENYPDVLTSDEKYIVETIKEAVNL